MAVRLAVLTLIKGKSNSSIHLQIDCGGTRNRQLLDISKSIWQYLFEKYITVITEYLPSSLNIKAVGESQSEGSKNQYFKK